MYTITPWTREPEPGVAEHAVPLPPEVPGTPDALLAAHAKTLAALTGEAEITTGYVPAEGGRPRPYRTTVRPGTWRELVAAAGRNSASDDLPYDTVLDPYGGDADACDAATVLRVGVSGGKLRVRYRTDVLDAGAAARIAGYHLTALTRIAAEPDTDHERHGLLSREELRFQLDGLAGPERALPDRRVHELIEDRAAAQPDAVAAADGEREWTYAELNARANRLGRALLARGLAREDVVAVVTERNLEWLAAVVAVFKAGGVYLPVEPHFPAGRIGTTLTRAGCAFVLTERGSTATLDAAGTDAPVLYVDDAWAEDHADDDLGVEVGGDQLAYIYFTSGSTGEPKGAMCEHAGFLNHVFAKIDDLDIGPADVVAQTAPQCFDISLWQLVSALVVGGRTHFVGQDTILDVRRFTETVARGRITVLQVVPSYLEAVLTELEQRPRELPRLRRVSVTGEAVKKELVRRWFAARPDIPLVNAYGLTETSDDTNHEVLRRVPDTARVPLGRPVANVRVYVVDRNLAPVPLGAPGEIVFSGVCVGRGYVNDPERTAAAFTEDPHRPGERLYRSGDQGRWLPDGKLEFLGRKDGMVKIRGFRIELGEVESALLRVAGVRDAAAVVVRGAQLVAFCAGDEPLDAPAVLEPLAASLPPYMVPSVLHWRPRLPLTANGKVDRRALTALAGELDAAGEAPDTPVERRLATVWAQALGIPVDRIGRRDHFFDRGGTSLSAVKLVVALDRTVSLKDVTAHPVLADLADLLERRAS
ncbi:non-ribosomal peptide synthetase [Streptomyces sp. CRN 30]|uniref:non-ribosomal peptide synthetase n=1 Tax=Streptomyces sp. CRN 30 TaxID=3075613 RepID=UPI002A82030A|nr:non-ribosomal peptide synthetase [Streptomyces sp. CRN 30]